MATNGNKARLKLNTKLANDETSSDFGSKTNMIDITSKTTGGNKAVMPGLQERTLTMEAIFEKKPSGTPTDLYPVDLATWQNNGTLVAFEYALSDVTGDIKYSGNLYIESVSFKSAANDKVTYSVTFAITGAVTLGTV